MIVTEIEKMQERGGKAFCLHKQKGVPTRARGASDMSGWTMRWELFLCVREGPADHGSKATVSEEMWCAPCERRSADWNTVHSHWGFSDTFWSDLGKMTKIYDVISPRKSIWWGIFPPSIRGLHTSCMLYGHFEMAFALRCATLCDCALAETGPFGVADLQITARAEWDKGAIITTAAVTSSEGGLQSHCFLWG